MDSPARGATTPRTQLVCRARRALHGLMGPMGIYSSDITTPLTNNSWFTKKYIKNKSFTRELEHSGFSKNSIFLDLPVLGECIRSLGAVGTVCRALRALQTSWVRGVVAPLAGETIFRNGSWILEACTPPFRASETLKCYFPWAYHPFSNAKAFTKGVVALRVDSPHAAQGSHGPLGPCRAQGPCIQAGCVVS